MPHNHEDQTKPPDRPYLPLLSYLSEPIKGRRPIRSYQTATVDQAELKSNQKLNTPNGMENHTQSLFCYEAVKKTSSMGINHCVECTTGSADVEIYPCQCRICYACSRNCFWEPAQKWESAAVKRSTCPACYRRVSYFRHTSYPKTKNSQVRLSLCDLTSLFTLCKRTGLVSFPPLHGCFFSVQYIKDQRLFPTGWNEAQQIDMHNLLTHKMRKTITTLEKKKQILDKEFDCPVYNCSYFNSIKDTPYSAFTVREKRAFALPPPLGNTSNAAILLNNRTDNSCCTVCDEDISESGFLTSCCGCMLCGECYRIRTLCLSIYELENTNICPFC